MKLTLIGMRGTGKSAVGHALAKHLGWGFVDADQRVEQRAGRTIAQIFAHDGEAEFRRLEAAVMQDLLGDDGNVVIAAGGGAVLNPETCDSMRVAGPVAWLTAPCRILAERLQADEKSETQRPSLTGNPLTEELEQIFRARRKLYQQTATIAVPTEQESPAAIAADIAERLDDHIAETTSRAFRREVAE